MKRTSTSPSFSILATFLSNDSPWYIVISIVDYCKIGVVLQFCYLFIFFLFTRPDQSADVLCDYIEQLAVGRDITIQTVAYDCTNHHTNVSEYASFLSLMIIY